MFKFILLVSVVILTSQSHSALPPRDAVVVTLLPNVEFRCCSEGEANRQPIYCYYGTPKTLTNVWQTVSASVEMKKPDKYEVYQGADESDVLAHYESSSSRWGNMFNWGRKSITLNPFNTTCLGIRSAKDYTLKIKVTPVNSVLVGMFSVGALLFFLSPVLVHSQVFYYIAGISVGVFASVLVFLYFIFTLLPLKRPAMLGMMAGGSTVVLYFFQSIVDNLLVFMPMYTQLVYGYLTVSGFISFVVCYRFGPLSNPRSKNLIQWSIQILSLVLVVFSSYNLEAVVAIALLIVLLCKFPVTKMIINSIRNYAVKSDGTVVVPKKPTSMKKLYCSKRKFGFLSQDEYRHQGKVETERGLEEIRQYCTKRWPSLRGRIRSRSFEKFLTGAPHVSKRELEAKIMEELLTDEED